MVEPVDGLGRIATRATVLAASEPAEAAYPAPVGLTPEHVARGIPMVDPPGTWDHPTWRLLDFSFSGAHSYSFAFDGENAPGRAVFHAVAHGDLDGDGLLSTFEVSGESRDGAEPVVFPVESHREVE
jgi:hypothetical protein